MYVVVVLLLVVDDSDDSDGSVSVDGEDMFYMFVRWHYWLVG